MLIHAASGGVGLAAIQLAQQRGATVFATASTYKRATLREMGVEYVYDSRSTDFADQILADTGGAGVDVVLNSLTNEGFVEATVRATAQGGRFAEIAKRDIWTHAQMAAARPDIDYEIVALDATIEQEPERVGNLLAELADSMASGELAPLAVEVYPLTEAKTAFRRMQQARHIGKIVLQMPKPLQPRDDRSYLITGGLGALGLYTAAHLAQLGAGDIVLTSRRMPDADAQRTIADITERYRCRIHTFAADVGDESQVGGAAGTNPGGVAAARGGGTRGGRARRRAADTAERGAFPDDVGAQGVRCPPPGSVDAATTTSSSSSCTRRPPVCSVRPVRPTM